MNRSVALGLAVAVIGGLVALYVLVIRDDSPAPATAPAPAAATPSGTSAPGPSLEPATPPSLTSTKQRPVAGDSTGMELTDHRTAGEGKRELEAGSAAPRGPVVPRSVVSSVHYGALKQVVACGNQVDPADRGTRPKIGATMKVAISDGMMKVTEVTPQTQDLAGPALAAAKTCVHDALLGMTVPAPDQPDADGLDLSLNYAVR